ncbi:MAG TPA: hypothetical protein VNO30_02735 [Kofleriaceae bacterium]|nr:hypothetical protein [Kofleriaceae bacterium]
MSDITGSYRFLAWARSGLAAASSVAVDNGRLRLPVTLTVRLGAAATDNVTRTLRLHGPGDVVGLDGAQIIRREPRPGTADFEPNYFPLVEFDAPELPWLFSPDLHAVKPLPWLTLVVLRRELARISVDPRRPLPWISLMPADARKELPELAESWAWAHVQLTSGGDLPEALDGRNPELTLSRILCPRRLQPRQQYLACLVPVYRAGVQAGLGEPVDASAAPAWPPPGGWDAFSGSFELPIYDHWEFATGEVGDFEVLARRLRAKVVGDEIGGLALDISDPDPDPAFDELNLGSPTTLPFEGALISPTLPAHQWPGDVKGPFQEVLEELIEAPPDVDPTVLRPPIYGAFHAGVVDQLPELEAGAPWVRDLNLDPSFRATAALGTQVVQRLQEELMASAWDQAGELERGNAMLRQAQVARATTAATLDKHISGLPDDSLARVTEPLHSRVRLLPNGDLHASQTLRASVKKSVFPAAALSPSFRRALRPAGPLGRRLPQRVAKDMSGSLAEGKLKVRMRPARGGAEFKEVTKAAGGKQRFEHLDKHKHGGWTTIANGGLYAGTDPYAPPPPPPPTPELTLATPVATTEALQPVANDDGGGEARLLSAERLSGINNRFKNATELLWNYLQRLPVVQKPPEPRDELKLDKVGVQLTARDGVLNPDRTVAREVTALVDEPRARARQAAAELAPQEPSLDLRPRAATPRFPQPMVEQLIAIDREMLLPGIDRIAADTVGILFGNTRFIEAFMVGINHELSRELLWRGLPADLAATFADRFWDIRGGDAQADSTQQIPKIAAWTSGLGGNAKGVGETGMLVLIIRGRLLQRYPHTAIYAAKAVQGATSLVPGSEELYPEFRGTIDPDVTYLGFKLGEDTARGGGTDPGWFFVIQEQPTAPRFGLDEPDDKPLEGSWANLDWSDVVRNPDELAAVRHVSVAGPLAESPSTPARTMKVLAGHDAEATWGTDAAQMAAITYQRPMRIAIHASTMLPPKKETPP